MSRIRADQLVNRVGSGGPKFPNGVADGFSVSGIVTATSFRGDGSQLSGIDAATLKSGSDIKVQAVSGGANITGNVAATGNVTAVDATFSGNTTVQGNLTVNGTTTTIDTAVTSVDSLQVDGNVGIGTTNATELVTVGSAVTTALLLVKPQSDAIDISVSSGNFSPHYQESFRIHQGQPGSGTERVRITSAGHILPGADNAQDLGSSSKRFANIYTGDLNLSNEGAANDVDGTWGQYTIQEGENDLFLINRRTGKKYKFNLTEVE